MNRLLTGIIAAGLLMIPAAAAAHTPAASISCQGTGRASVADVDVTGKDYQNGVVVTISADGHQIYSPAFAGTFEVVSPNAQKPPARTQGPLARISPACGDPMIRWTLIARDAPATFHITAVTFHNGQHTWTTSVAAHSTKVSSYHHLQGGSRVTVRANGAVLATKIVEPPGSYGRCPA